jgi:hypothetical protein
LHSKSDLGPESTFDELLLSIDTAENPLAQRVVGVKMTTTVLMSELAVFLSHANVILRLDDGENVQSMSQNRLLS